MRRSNCCSRAKSRPTRNHIVPAAGASKRHDGSDARHCTVLFYDVADHLDVKTEVEKFAFLRSLGFATPRTAHGSVDDVLALYQQYGASIRASLDYEIDGLVIYVNSLNTQALLGDVNHRPRGAVAFKFASPAKISTVLDIRWDTGASGRVTPVAIVAPVELAGAVITSSRGGQHALSGALAPGALLLLSSTALGFPVQAGDKLFLLRSASGDPPGALLALDGVAVMTVPRGRSSTALAAAQRRGAAPTEVPWLYPDTATPGAANVFPPQAEIVINEIMYHPPAVSGPDGAAQDPLEWLELFNRGAQPVDLSGYQLVDAVEYAFPKGTSIAPGGYLVVASDVSAMRTTSGAAPRRTGGPVIPTPRETNSAEPCAS